MKKDLKKERKDLDKEKVKLLKNIDKTESISALLHTLKSNPCLDETMLGIMIAITPAVKDEVLTRLRTLCKISLEINDLVLDYTEKKVEELKEGVTNE